MNEQPRQQRRPVLVGVDGSPASRQALVFAADEARMRGADLVVLTAVTVVDPMWVRPYADIPHDTNLVAKAEQEIRDVVAEELGDDAGVTLEVAATAAGPAATLVEKSAEADLLVVGSRGRGGFRGLVLGSVSMQCVLHAKCPVTVVHAMRAGDTSAWAAKEAAQPAPLATSGT